MNLGFSPDDFGFVIVAMLGLLLLLPVALGGIGLLARMVGSVAGIAAGWLMLGIAYAASAARAAQIIGATHSHHWRNAIFFVGNYAATLLVFYTLWFAFEWLVAKIRRRAAISI